MPTNDSLQDREQYQNFVIKLFENGSISSQTVLDAFNSPTPSMESNIEVEENSLYNYLNAMNEFKIERMREQVPHNSIMWLEIKGD